MNGEPVHNSRRATSHSTSARAGTTTGGRVIATARHRKSTKDHARRNLLHLAPPSRKTAASDARELPTFDDIAEAARAASAPRASLQIDLEFISLTERGSIYREEIVLRRPGALDIRVGRAPREAVFSDA